MGFAYTEKIRNSNIPIICILGDGELQEGTLWESLLHIFNMNLNIKILIDFNNSIETNTSKIDEGIKNFINWYLDSNSIHIWSLDNLYIKFFIIISSFSNLFNFIISTKVWLHFQSYCGFF